MRQVKPGRGGGDDLKPFVETQRAANPARKDWPAIRKRVFALGVEESTLRSVVSEWAGRVIEPRNQSPCESRRHCCGERQHRSAVAAEKSCPVGESRHARSGPAGTWEVPSSPSQSRFWESG